MPITITGDELKLLVRKATAGRWLASRPDKYLGAWDSRLYLPTADEVVALSESVWRAIEDLSNGEVTEAFDCDDYAFAYCGIVRAVAARTLGRRFSIAVGIAMGVFTWVREVEYHVCNWTVIRDGPASSERMRLCWIEPQINPRTAERPWTYGAETARDLRVLII